MNATRLLDLSQLLTTVFLAVPSVAYAQTSPDASAVPLDFEWLRGHGAEMCPDADQVIDKIKDKAPRTVFSSGAKHKIEVLISRTGDVWTARIEERDATGAVKARAPISSETEDCAAITDAAVFDVMLLLEHPEELGAIAAPAANCPTIDLVKVQPARAKPKATSPPESPKMTFTARASIRYGLLPGVAPDIGFFGTIGEKWWELSSGLSWMPEAATEDGNFAFGLATVWLGGCLHPLRRPHFTLSGCGHALVGAMHNAALDLYTFRPTGVGELPWVGVAASPRLRIFLRSRLILELGGDIAIPITRYRSTDVGRGQLLYEQLPVAVSGFLGVGMSIP